ncbi:MAG: uroporphyrinogen decarboxylase family protein [Acidimicrobiales bacterium]|jgi:hypothetical protein
MMGSRDRVQAALEHRDTDRVPLDLGGSDVTGMHVDSVYKLRQALQLDPPGTPVKVVDVGQQLGEIGSDLLDALGVDVVPLRGSFAEMDSRQNENWKSWTTFHGTPVLVPEDFNTEPEPNGDILRYPCGDKTVPPCGRMPCGGFYFDALTRQDSIDDDHLNVEHNLEEYEQVSDANLTYLKTESERLEATGKAILAQFPIDVGNFFSGTNLKHPRGIRDITEWYVSINLRRDYVYEVFERQCEISLQNLKKIHTAVGERVTAVVVTENDLGTQNGPFISPKAYRELWRPFNVKVNDWIHSNTNWKTFMHSCGSIWRFLDDIASAGFDCLNPVQTSAADMDPQALKAEYGSRFTFWGAGIDTQRVLPFGTPDEVRTMVRERMRIFRVGGGFVFNTIHNVQAGIPTENLLALYEAIGEYR